MARMTTHARAPIGHEDDPALREWVVAQAVAGIAPEQVLAALCERGLAQQAAIEYVEQVLRGHVESHARDNGLPLPATVPAPIDSNGPSALVVEGRKVHVLASLLHPRVVVFGGFLSDAECDELVATARPRLRRSSTLDLQTGEDTAHEHRTSQGMAFQRGQTPLCARIERRIATLLDWPVENGEGLQVLRYGVGAEYRPHYDYFDPAFPGTAATLRRGGQRVASLVMYLNTPARGGATVFPDAHFEAAAVKGNAVFFSYDRPHPVTASLHGGAPVLEGEKWIATKWLRAGRHD